MLEYRIVDVPARRVEMHSQPTPAGYDRATHHGDGERIATATAATTVDVSALLG